MPLHDDGWGENRDGYDTVEWIAAQSWCDGNVGTIGGSYAGATQYRLAPTRPPHLRAMYVRESSADYWAEWVYQAAPSSSASWWSGRSSGPTTTSRGWPTPRSTSSGRAPREAIEELPSWHRSCRSTRIRSRGLGRLV